MQVIIPMSGFGERFRKAGYTLPKPLIPVDGKPIIEYIVNMFSCEENFIFICNREHLEHPDYELETTLKRICPTGTIVSIEPHRLGPVHAVQQAYDRIDMSLPTVVNYCDFTCDWDYQSFKTFVEQTKCDGAIPAYRGFHPHTLWSNYYAYMKEDRGVVSDIQEKQAFTDSPTEEFASSGTYYFSSGQLMKNYCDRTVQEGWMVNHEYYFSMVYKPMLNDDLDVRVFELDHFMQWGTPADLEEYLSWSALFRDIKTNQKRPVHAGALMLPMVGLGSRFKREGYAVPKPLIEVMNAPMALSALSTLPVADKYVFIVRKDMDGLDKLTSSLDNVDKHTAHNSWVYLDEMTDGQASTCLYGMEAVDEEKPLSIAACDNALLYDSSIFNTIMQDDDVDIIVWGKRAYSNALRRPEMYGWIDSDENNDIKAVSVKKPLKNPIQNATENLRQNAVIVGAFTFKKASYFIQAAKCMKVRKALVNGEYYVDTLINDTIALGLKCKLFEVKHYVSWGTPNELKSFQYWQDCFSSWKDYPYKY